MAPCRNAGFTITTIVVIVACIVSLDRIQHFCPCMESFLMTWHRQILFNNNKGLICKCKLFQKAAFCNQWMILSMPMRFKWCSRYRLKKAPITIDTAFPFILLLLVVILLLFASLSFLHFLQFFSLLLSPGIAMSSILTF